MQNTLLVVSLGIIATALTSSTLKINQPAAIATAPQETKIIGSDSTFPAMKLVARAKEAKVENTKINFLLASKSQSSIVGTKEGLVDLIDKYKMVRQISIVIN
ncbi:MAG: hypothetical protein F6K36_21520 [Symploca sp. SIO3C6]|nr:hypothetical protein [Symploca sp. SIO3C6]NET05336.1 hypothetical protein [Symploca sp. SIO2B6]